MNNLLTASVSAFLDETASDAPAPGGGSVSALAAALSSALVSMVCRLTIGKKKYTSVEDEMKMVLEKSEEFRAAFQSIVDEDTKAFQQVMTALGMPRETDDDRARRSAALESATKKATEVPLRLLRTCEKAVPLVRAVAEKGNANSRSDAGVAALLLSSAAQGAAMNVLINLGGLSDAGYVLSVRRDVDELEESVVRECRGLRETIRKGLAK